MVYPIDHLLHRRSKVGPETMKLLGRIARKGVQKLVNLAVFGVRNPKKLPPDDTLNSPLFNPRPRA